jgi:hypothetical protein
MTGPYVYRNATVLADRIEATLCRFDGDRVQAVYSFFESEEYAREFDRLDDRTPIELEPRWPDDSLLLFLVDNTYVFMRSCDVPASEVISAFKDNEVLEYIASRYSFLKESRFAKILNMMSVHSGIALC